MIFDGIPFDAYLPEKSSVQSRSLISFIDLLENRFGGRFLIDARGVPFERPDLLEPLRLAALLKEHDIIQSFGESFRYPDEPQIKIWYAVCNNAASHRTGGSSFSSDSDALFAALAEALERYLWYTQEDYFRNPRIATLDGIRKYEPAIAPKQFVGFSEMQRKGNPDREMRSDTEYQWIKVASLISGKDVYIPSQIVSGIRKRNGMAREPLIRRATTNGLATWPTKAGAIMRGVLELFEREAYMITWMNQLTLPRIALDTLSKQHPSLAYSLEQCRRYRLKVHAVEMLTDAPTHCVMAVVEDESGLAPRFTVGLKSHRALHTAIEKALSEALRARLGQRKWAEGGNVWDTKTPADLVGHYERLYYWSVPEHARHLEFLIAGKESEPETKPWDSDTEEEHLKRALEWCAQKKFELLDIPLGDSAKNPTPWHVEMVVIPELQPTYLTEDSRLFGGTRWQDVPKAFGYTPRNEPYTEMPHPFA